MNEQQAVKLREPFPAGMIGKLPRVWCKACSENKQQRHCPQHEIKQCQVCRNKITEAHLHLDYVGHAATTDRLLQVDPEWTWEPLAVGPNGEPLFVNGGLWIKLTVAGVTRIGFGDGSNPKECIGDAIRNAAMRFGVALDLWAKEDLHAEDGGRELPAGQPNAPQPKPDDTAELASKLFRLADEYKQLVPDFDALIVRERATEKVGKSEYRSWLLKQIAAFENNIAQKKAEANAADKFPIPDKAKATA